jgi:hypothetical protein
MTERFGTGKASMHSQVKAVVSQVVLPIIFTVGLVGNSCNICIFSYKIRRRLRSGYTNVTDMSAVVGLLALAASDLAFTASALPSLFLSGKIYTLDSSQWEQARLTYVYVHIFLMNVFICTSTWFMCVVSFERFLMICKPFHRQWNSNLTRTVLTYCVVVTCSIVISLPLLLKYAYVCEPPCPARDSRQSINGKTAGYGRGVTSVPVLASESVGLSTLCGECHLIPTAVLGDSRSSVAYYAVHSVLMGIVPFVILLLCNVRLLIAVRANYFHNRRTRCGQYSNYGGGGGGSKLYRITFILILVVTMYLFLVAPSLCMELLKPLLTGVNHDRYLTAIVLTNAIQSINYSINFPIYMISSRPFRNSFKKIFHKLCHFNALSMRRSTY